MCFTMTPYDRVIKIIQYRKGLYDFYYTLVTLPTGYNYYKHSLYNHLHSKDR